MNCCEDVRAIDRASLEQDAGAAQWITLTAIYAELAITVQQNPEDQP
jgi:hypothetical protein